MSLRDELQKIYDQHGRLTPRLVVETAREEDHPLHSRVFDKSVGDAAEAWYLHQAHKLIQRARVKVTEGTDSPKDLGGLRAFYAVRPDPSDDSEDAFVYEPAEQVAVDEFLLRSCMRMMESETSHLQRRQSEFLQFVKALGGEQRAA